MELDPARRAAAGEILTRLYADRGEETLQAILALADRHAAALPAHAPRRWDHRDVVLIAYGDQVQMPPEPTLHTLCRFLADHGLDRIINTVHILPFCPYSSDDGFSVIDYRAIDDALGDWSDVQRLGQHVELMFDLVLNHVSQHSEYFQAYRRGQPPYDRFFIEVDPNTDLSAVTRPRSLDLLTKVETDRGTRHVWTTFSDDQIDLNFAEPAVLLEMLDVLLFYVAQGARIVRLDAIAFLWKRIGTDCIHLKETHLVVKLMRLLLDAWAPHVLLLTETNVPHRENVSYFGDGDEAHMVYQFSLPPLLLDALLQQDAGPLHAWLSDLEATAAGTTFLNFTASHDGVGVRPLEGLVPPERLEALVAAVRARGGRVSTRSNPSGADTPYELNISYFDALGEPEGLSPELHVRRFLASQAIMLALRGVPAVYFHSLMGTPNFDAGVEQSGQPRRINRRKYRLDELVDAVFAEGAPQAMVFEGYQRLLAARIAEPAFHPDGAQRILPLNDPAVLALVRTCPQRQRHVLVAANLSDRPRRLDVGGVERKKATGTICRSGPEGASHKMHLSLFSEVAFDADLLSGDRLDDGAAVSLAPFQVAWLPVTGDDL